MISVAGLCKYYAGFAAVEDVSFHIESGEIVGLLGLNGAGKSTILKILGCFLMPSAGRVVIGGFDSEEAPDEIRKIIGFLPDTPPLYPEMTVASYLEYVAKLKDVSKANLSAYVEDAIDKTNLHDVREVRLGELSHGFRQRVGIAQALVHKPKVLILDEPINGLDPVQIVEMRDLIKSLKGQHTVILSSHILSEITRTCDRIIIINKGQVVAEGREDSLTEKSQRRMIVRVQARADAAKVSQHLKNVPGLERVEEGSNETADYSELTLHCAADIRARVAETLVKAGIDLLEMARQDDGLENIFVQMVQKGTVENKVEGEHV